MEALKEVAPLAPHSRTAAQQPQDKDHGYEMWLRPAHPLRCARYCLKP